MLGLQIASPGYLVVELVVVLLQQLDRLGVGYTAEIAVHYVVQSFKQAGVHKLVQESHFLRCLRQHVGDDVLDHILGQFHIVRKIGKSDLGLDHPELRRVAGGVGVLGTEGRTECIDILKCHSEGFAVELTGYGQAGLLTEEILGVIHLTGFGFRHVGGIHGGNLEHLAGALTVASGDQRGVYVHEIPILEELMDGVSRQRADAENRLEQIGSGAEVGDGTQKLRGVTLLLQGIIGGRGTLHRCLDGLHFQLLLSVGSKNDLTANDDSGAHVQFGQLRKVREILRVDDLEGLKEGAVADDEETEILGGAVVFHPSAHGDLLAIKFFTFTEQLPNVDQIHN